MQFYPLVVIVSIAGKKNTGDKLWVTIFFFFPFTYSDSKSHGNLTTTVTSKTLAHVACPLTNKETNLQKGATIKITEPQEQKEKRSKRDQEQSQGGIYIYIYLYII